MFVPVSSPFASLFLPCAFLCLFMPCCPCLHPSPVPNHHTVCLSDWFPLFSPPVSHCLPRLDCSHLSLVICCLCVYIVLVFLFLVASSSLYVALVCSLCFQRLAFLFVKLIYSCFSP